MWKAWCWVTSTAGRFFGTIAVGVGLLIGALAIQTTYFPTAGDLELQEQNRRRATSQQAKRAAEVAASETKARTFVACETALRNQYRLAIDVSPFNAEYNVKEYVTIVRGQDDLPDGRVVDFRCKFSPDGKLVSAEAH